MPLLREDQIVGALMVRRRRPGAFGQSIIELMQSFASQSALAIQNARLFQEIEDKSRQLELASQHKSQFLANMSHELRTPLNAILGYTELMQDGLYGELPTKTKEVLDRVQKNGKHLLGLINDVLDLAKIEAGQLVLGIEGYSMQDVVQTVVSATESWLQPKNCPSRSSIPRTCPADKATSAALRRFFSISWATPSSSQTEARSALPPRQRMVRFAWPLSIRGRVFRKRSKPAYSMSSIRSTAPTPRRRVAPGSASPSPSALSNCTAGESGWNRRSGKGSTFQFEIPIRAEQRAGVA